MTGKLFFWSLFLILAVNTANAQYIRVQPQVINAEKGLPSNTIFEVIEGEEGLLWISTEQGVYIYDGYTITALNRLLGDSIMRNEPASIYKEENETIWIHQDGQLVSYNKLQRIFLRFTYPLKPGVAKNNLRPITKNGVELVLQHAEDSCLIFNTKSTMFYWQKLPSITNVDSRAIQNPPIYANGYYFKVNQQNELLVVDSIGNRQRKIIDLQPTNDIARGTKIISIDNKNCLVGSGFELLVVNTQTWQVQPIQDISGNNLISTGKIMHLYKNRSGHVYMSTNSSGIFSIPIQRYQFDLFRSSKPQNNFIRSIFHDQSTQKIYAGLYFNTVAVFNDNTVPDELTTNKWQKLLQAKKINVVNRVDKIGLKEWIIFANGKQFFYFNESNETIKNIPIIAPSGVDSSVFAKDNFSSFANVEKTVEGEYILIYLRQILQIKYKEGVFYTTKLLHTLQSNEGVFIDNNQHIFIGNDGYVNEYTKEWDFVRRIQLPELIQVKAVTKDSNGLLWIGTRNGIFIYSDNQLIQKLTEKNGLLNSFIYTLYADKSGFVWCTTNKGLASIQINKFEVKTYTKFDGLQDDEFNSGAIYVDSSGKIYFGGINGITVFNPKNIQQTKPKEKVEIIDVRGNGRSLYSYLLNGNNKLVADYTINNFVFYFSAFGLNTAADSYEYRVNDERSWAPIRGQNFFNLYLTGGVHKIYIRKLNQPETETIFNLKVRLPFYRQFWFLLLVLITVLLLGGLLINRRQKTKLLEKERLLTREFELQAERERISKELHDNLGAHANIISYHSQQLSDKASSDFDAAFANNTFGKIKSSSDEILLSLRETVWALQQSKITAREAWIRFQNFIFRLQDSFQNIQFTLAELSSMPEVELDYQQAVHLIRILQEAANNAVKHAAATDIKIDIEQQPGGFKIQVIDNGAGFNPAETNNNGNGLENMRSRAKAAGLIVTIESEVGKGTLVNIIFKST